jgi:hypothetical protein
METLKKIEELTKQIMEDAQKCYEKGTYSRGRSARVELSELAKLCKLARAELLEHMKKQKGE